MRVLVLGHWDLSAEDLSGKDQSSALLLRWLADQADGPQLTGTSRRALQGLVSGIRLAARNRDSSNALQLRALPIGPADAFLEALSDEGPISGSFKPIVAGRREASTVGVGSELRDLEEFKGTVLVEGGHSWPHDWGIGLLAALTQQPSLAPEDGPEVLEEAIEKARYRLSGRTIILSASTSRPLLGSGGTGILAPDLTLRDPNSTRMNQVQTQQWKQTLIQAYARTKAKKAALDLFPQGGRATAEMSGSGPQSSVLAGEDPTLLPGSGAAGGAGAVLAALGVPIRSTSQTLSTLLQLPKLISQSDLVVIVEPHLDSPNLVDSVLQEIARTAALTSVPVVAVGSQTSLSSPERADLGIHGISLVDPNVASPFVDAGRRIGQTWIR